MQVHPAIHEVIEAGGGVDVRPLAKAAGVAPATLYRAINRGEVEAIKIGKRVTVPAHVARKLLKLPEAPAVVKAA
ncbi:hypothetical protein [Enterovirga sp. CN4-39]|uniref:hypothetical protein n=1 Tax=Enterovirga sp. CN4-39 TaxID=3400910 RepID=UPI003C0B36FF